MDQTEVSDAENGLAALCAMLFIVTAKSDNAVKCQYPIHFRRDKGNKFPKFQRMQVAHSVVPDVLKSADIIKATVRLCGAHRDEAREFFRAYVDFLLADDQDKRQFRAIVDAFGYAEKSPETSGGDLLAPLVAFQVRGSVAASGGHDPEQIVRDHLTEWGLSPLDDFNLSDVTAGALEEWLIGKAALAGSSQSVRTKADDKTRAFDFVIPCYRVDVPRRIFIQSQFYAGDSGSVSHKNVDQASKARSHAASIFPEARFVELVDGAGYCASLRKDLRWLLFAEDTYDFFQLRSIPVRLRRILQQSGIITPLDIALRIHEGVHNRNDLLTELRLQPIAPADPEGLLGEAERADWIVRSGDRLGVHDSRLALVGRYALLDRIIAGSRHLSGTADLKPSVLVPGYGPNYGIERASDWDDVAYSELLSELTLIEVEGEMR
jgi:hypothetical protein